MNTERLSSNQLRHKQLSRGYQPDNRTIDNELRNWVRHIVECSELDTRQLGNNRQMLLGRDAITREILIDVREQLAGITEQVLVDAVYATEGAAGLQRLWAVGFDSHRLMGRSSQQKAIGWRSISAQAESRLKKKAATEVRGAG